MKKALRPKTLIYQWFPALVLARLARFERAAFRLGGERSILLSYRRMYEIVVFEPFAFFAEVEGSP